MAACGDAEGIQFRSEFCTPPLVEQVKLILTAWETTSARLLVFDNCEDEALLEQARLKHGTCQVLLTSRRHHGIRHSVYRRGTWLSSYAWTVSSCRHRSP